uniref:Kyphoscoliosis peptidase n=1 Tax=Lygus hesperus TaxID=30085 RepID=A0A0A9YXV2_LYGHE
MVQQFPTKNKDAKLRKESLKSEYQKKKGEHKTSFRGQSTVEDNANMKQGRGDGLIKIRKVQQSWKSLRGGLKLNEFYSDAGLSKGEHRVMSELRKGFQIKKKRRFSKLKAAKKKEQTRDRTLKKLDGEISWIYAESSWSDVTDQEGFSPETTKKKSTLINDSSFINEAFRDHVIKELLKQGKDLKWYEKGVKRAADKIDKKLLKPKPEALKSVASVARVVSDFLLKRTRPYYRYSTKKVKADNHLKTETAPRKN